jgi:enoyl-CoA hydratase
MSNYETITVEKRDRVAVLTISRPDKLNALNSKVHSEGVAALNELRADASVRVVIITGAGEKSFIAGADISEFAGQTPVTQRNLFYEKTLFNSIDNFPKPVIAMINGFCLGGGNELALACDIRVASENARFAQPEINLGIMCGGGGTQRLTRLIGEGRAMEIILTGDMIDAQTALKFGLVNHVHPAEQLEAKTMEIDVHPESHRRAARNTSR